MPLDPLTATFMALADPTRRAILARLAQGDATVKELAELFPITGPAISRHLRVLERARLIFRGRDRQSRPRHLMPGPIKEVAAWAERYRDLWESSFDHLLDDLSERGATGQGSSFDEFAATIPPIWPVPDQQSAARLSSRPAITSVLAGLDGIARAR
jgi:DNA-binding transcriptional ArsR family regulator